MKGLAKRLAPDEVEYWGIVGLLHDLDEEQCDWQNDMSVHGPTSVEILKKEGIEDKVLFDAICAHNPKSGMKAKTKLQYAVLAADPMSGFVKAVAQIYPDKKIASVKHKSVMKRFNELRLSLIHIWRQSVGNDWRSDCTDFCTAWIRRVAACGGVLVWIYSQRSDCIYHGCIGKCKW